MKTKFILHGGFSRGEKPEDDAFYKEILKGTSQKVKILLVYFAKEVDRIPKNKEEDIVQFNKNKGEKVLVFEVANEESFLKQVAWADVVYLHGGDVLKLLDALKKFPNLRQLFNGKIIAGDSAGANVLAVTFYSHRNQCVFNGLGFLPIRILCHYSDKHKDVFSKQGSDLETLYLPEYRFRVFQ